MTLSIGNVSIDSPFLLAPLAGITDAPMRRICGKQGASLVYSEMISAKGLRYGDKNTERLLFMYDDEGSVALQLFGSEPEVMKYAAEHLENRKNVILDVNMGCPVPKVVKNGEGSALLKNPDLAGMIIEQMTKATDKPITAKIRMGWDADSVNAVDVALVLQQAGAAAVAVHGRTREQYYSGRADWDIIKQVKASVSIPVIGNGDIFCGQDAIDMMEYTGCDFVMIARGALGNPWIFAEAQALWQGNELPKLPEPYEKRQMIEKHFHDLLELKGEYAAVREMRKHIGWYLKGMPGAAAMRREINQITDAAQLIERLRRIK